MSRTTAIVCDGCGRVFHRTTHAPYPVDWVRLSVFRRRGGGADVRGYGTVDVCQPICAARALDDGEVFTERIVGSGHPAGSERLRAL